MTPTRTAPRQHADAAQIPADPLRAFIDTCLRRKQTPLQIIDAVKDTFGIEIDYGQVIPCWKGEITIPTQTEPRPDKESVQFAADEPEEPLFTRMTDAETLDPVSEAAAQPLFSLAPESSIARDASPLSGDAGADDAPATQTGRRQDADSRQGGAKADDAPATQTGRRQDADSRQGGPDADGAPATQTGRRQDPDSRQGGTDTDEAPATQTGRRQDADSRPGDADADEAPATQTGRRQDEKTRSILTDEMKAFVVRGLARYETPTRVAASVQAQFGIAIDRRQVYAYDPAGSRRPAQRWIDLHAATRAKFLDAVAEIGIAQKVVRLRMLDRFANRMDEANYPERAAAFLAQAAKECGGFYERYARPKGAAAPASA